MEPTNKGAWLLLHWYWVQEQAFMGSLGILLIDFLWTLLTGCFFLRA
jgi:hypothetical protein